jgi:signal transduction histidine kinase/ActR/RegA family two-component response regulator
MSDESVWEKRFHRERASRKKAEQLLEDKSLELWQINQNLEKLVQERTEELKVALQKAESANRSKSDFLANMSHEIRTPLNGIIGFSSILSHDLKDPKHNEYAHIIHKSAEGLLDIINDILDFSKIESGKMELDIHEFELKNEINNINSMFIAKAKEKNINLQIDIDQAIPSHLLGDSLKIRQVLINLIGNALKFSDRGTTIMLNIKLKSQNNDAYAILFSVKDQGIGIPLEKQQKIFNPFSQMDNSTTREYGGTGLGLAISGNMIKLMDSQLQLTSEEGRGSDFYFTLNLKATDQQIEKNVQSSDKTISKKNQYPHCRILVAEDNKTNQMLMSVLLNQRAMTFDIADNGLEAIKLFKQNRYDLVLMDIHMPQCNGLEATQAILEYEQENNAPHTPIVALTANAVKGQKEEYLQNGMDNYLTKPIDINSLDNLFHIYLTI